MKSDVSTGRYEAISRWFDRLGTVVGSSAGRYTGASARTATWLYGYENRGLPSQVVSFTNTHPTPVVDASYTYTPSGALATRTLGTLASQPYAYDVRLRLTGIGSVASTTHPYSATYAYTETSQLASWEQRSATPSGAPADARARSKWAFEHDASGRLLSADYSYHNGSAPCFP